jgi:hypothetical protein
MMGWSVSFDQREISVDGERDEPIFPAKRNINSRLTFGLLYLRGGLGFLALTMKFNE